jgi:hypothetical protein
MMSNAYGLWLIGTTYVIGDQVGYDGQIWRSLTGSNIGHVPATGLYWSLVRTAGEQGTWQAGTNYVIGDQVEYKGGIWTAAADTVGVVPAVGADWTLVEQAPFNQAAAQAEMTGAASGVALLPVYATSSRPSATASGAGASYYDATLGKPGFSNGAVWKDAEGTTI